MENTPRGGDGNLAELVYDQPPELPDLDAAIEQATQARLFFLTGLPALKDNEST